MNSHSNTPSLSIRPPHTMTHCWPVRPSPHPWKIVAPACKLATKAFFLFSSFNSIAFFPRTMHEIYHVKTIVSRIYSAHPTQMQPCLKFEFLTLICVNIILVFLCALCTVRNSSIVWSDTIEYSPPRPKKSLSETLSCFFAVVSKKIIHSTIGLYQQIHLDDVYL